MQTLHLGMVEDQLREPERFVRHTFATWLEDAGIPARVIDEVMGHEATSRTGQQPGSAMGAHYRHTTREMAARIAMAIEQFWTQTPQYCPVGLAMGTRTCGAVLSSDDHGSSVERTAKLHPLWRERSGLPSVRGRVQAAGALQ